MTVGNYAEAARYSIRSAPRQKAGQVPSLISVCLDCHGDRVGIAESRRHVLLDVEGVSVAVAVHDFLVNDGALRFLVLVKLDGRVVGGRALADWHCNSFQVGIEFQSSESVESVVWTVVRRAIFFFPPFSGFMPSA